MAAAGRFAGHARTSACGGQELCHADCLPAGNIVETSNVIVATPDILKASAPAALERLLKGCSTLVVDEAHHITATTWKEVRDKYSHTKIAGPDVQFKKSNGVVAPLPEHLVVDPLIVRYADGTYSYNCYHIPANLDAGKFPVARLESWTWKGIPLNR